MKFNTVQLSLALASIVSAQNNCQTDPTASSCADFTISDADANKALDAICKDSTQLAGCSLRNMCNVNKNLSSTFCSPVAILATVCTTDSASDSNCATYTAVCSPKTGQSAVKQCKSSAPFPNMPSTKNMTNALLSGCNEMPGMDDCKVVIKPDSNGLLPIDNLGVYSAFCKSMPGMQQCPAWNKMCEASNKFDSICVNPKYGEGTKASASTPSTPSSSTKPNSASTLNVGTVGGAALMLASLVAITL